jgi:hypothetical protein
VAGLLLLIVGLGGLAVAGRGIAGQLQPRAFTAAQRQRIMAWEVARRWRQLPADRIFPAAIRYQLPGSSFGSAGALALTARRLVIARQASCAGASGAALGRVIGRNGCSALLRATYADSTRSLIVTVGVAVLRDGATARRAAGRLTSGASHAARAARLLLRPVAVPGTPAASFGTRQRQLSFVQTAGPYLVIATVGFADGRPRVPVRTDGFASLEMTSLAKGVDAAVAAPLAKPPPVPRCPGAPGC